MKSIALFFVAMSVSSAAVADIITFDYSVTLGSNYKFSGGTAGGTAIGNDVGSVSGLVVETTFDIPFATIAITKGIAFIDLEIDLDVPNTEITPPWSVTLSDFDLTSPTATITSFAFVPGSSTGSDPGASFVGNALSFNTTATTVASGGTINYRFSFTEFDSAAVPEPSSFALIAVGGGLLLSARRRKPESRDVDLTV